MSAQARSWVYTKVAAGDVERHPEWMREHAGRVVRTYADGSVTMRWRPEELRKLSD